MLDNHHMRPDLQPSISQSLEQARRVAAREESKRLNLERRVRELEETLGGARTRESDPLEQDLVRALSEEEQRAVEEAMQRETPMPFESKDAARDAGVFLRNQVVKSVSGIKIGETMNNIIRKLQRRALVGVAILTVWPSSFGKQESSGSPNIPETISALSEKEIEEKTSREILESQIDQPTWQELSPNAKRVYLYALTNIDSSYMIVDKPRATMYVIGKDKKMIASFPILLGKVKGEQKNTAYPDDDLAGPGATTPAGRYIIGHETVPQDSAMYQGRILNVYAEEGRFPIWKMSVHATYPGELEKRTKALQTPGIEDNRMTYGCVNLSRENFDKYLKGKMPEDAVLFILPDDPDASLNPDTKEVEQVKAKERK